jgi:phosphoserine phosphatase
VQHPVAVNPDEVLLRTARERGWPVLQLKVAATAA